MEHVDGVVALVGEAKPICDWGWLWEVGNPGCEVALPRANCSFGRVGVVDVRRYVLEGSLLGLDELFHILRSLVVHLV